MESMNKRICFTLIFLMLILKISAQTFQKKSSNSTSAGGVVVHSDSSYSYCFSRDYPYLLHFNSSGIFQWGKRYSFGIGGGYINGMALLPNNQIVIEGSCDNSSGGWNFFFAKLDSAGNVLFSQNSGTISDEYGYDTKISTSGSMFFAGLTHYSSKPFLLKANSAGSTIFSNIYSVGGNSSISAWKADGILLYNNSIFLAGNVMVNSGEKGEALLMKIDTLGNPIWAYTFGGPGDDAALSIALSNDGNLLLTGYTRFGQGNQDAFVAKMDTLGNILWFKTFGTNRNDCGEHITQLQDGRIIVTGWSQDTIGSDNLLMILFLDSLGDEITARMSNYQNTSVENSCTWIPYLEQSALLCGLSVTSLGYEYAHFDRTNSAGSSGCDEYFTFLTQMQFSPYRDSKTVSLYASMPVYLTNPIQLFSSTNVLNMTVCTSTCNANAFFSSSENQGCINDSISFIPVDTNAISYRWFIDNTLIDTLPYFGFRFNSEGIFHVKLVLSNQFCSDSMIQTVNINSLPVAGFTFNRELMLVQFINTSTSGTQWQWNYGDGNGSTYTQEWHAYPDTGIYSAYLVATNNCGIDTFFTQFNIRDSLSPSFEKCCSYPGGLWTTGSAITLTKDGGYASVGTNEGFFGNTEDYIVNRFSENGVLKWSRIYENISTLINESDNGTAITSSLDQGFVFGGVSNGVISIVKIDSTGWPFWSYQANTGASHVSKIIQLTDSSFVITGQYLNQIGYILKLSWLGKLIWMKTYSASLIGSDIITTSDGGLAMIGNSSSGSDIYLLRTDSVGNLQWSKKYNSTLNDEGNHLIQLADKGFLVAGNSWNIFIGADALVMKIDSSGQLLWANYIKESSASTEKPRYIGELPNHKIELIVDDIGYTTRMLLLDSSANIIWCKRYYDPPNDPHIYNAVYTKGGRIVALGDKDSSALGYGGLWLTSIDTSGLSGCSLFNYNMINQIGNLTTSTPVETVQSINITGNASFYMSNIDLNEYTYCYTDICTPVANFTYNFSGSNVDFTNISTGMVTSILWDFGDGQQSTQYNPSHIYWFPGQYNVCLYVFSNCGVDTFCQTITVLVTSNPKDNYQIAFTVWPNPTNGVLNIFLSTNFTRQVSIFDASGRCLLTEENISGNNLKLDVSYLSDGLYFLKVHNFDGSISSQKIMIGNY